MANLFQCATSHIKKVQHSESENNLHVELEKWKKDCRRRPTNSSSCKSYKDVTYSFAFEQMISFSRTKQKKMFPINFLPYIFEKSFELINYKIKKNICNMYCIQILNCTHGSFSFMSSFCNRNVPQKQ